MVFGQKSFNISHSITDDECVEPPCKEDDGNIGVSTSNSGFTNTLSGNDIYQGEFTIESTNNTSYGLVLSDDGSRYFYESSEETGSHVSEDDSEIIDLLTDASCDLALSDDGFTDVYESSQEDTNSCVVNEDQQLSTLEDDKIERDGLLNDDTYDLEGGLQIGELVDDSNAFAGSPIDISNFGIVDIYDSSLVTYDQVKPIKVTDTTTETIIDLTEFGIEIENDTNE
tara:strand:- start:1679 stop:2359 length:681 start_codon:yes stop_codon:yes gene_type:complete